jgi:hypothetical protein
MASSGCAVDKNFEPRRASYCKSNSYMNSTIDMPGSCLSCANLFFMFTTSRGPSPTPLRDMEKFADKVKNKSYTEKEWLSHERLQMIKNTNFAN